MGRRFESDGGQGTAEVRLLEGDVPAAGRGGVGNDPVQGELVSRGQQDQRVGRGVPVADELGKGEREVKGGVNGLTCLRPRRKIDSGDDVEAGATALPVLHGHKCTGSVNGHFHVRRAGAGRRSVCTRMVG